MHDHLVMVARVAGGAAGQRQHRRARSFHPVDEPAGLGEQGRVDALRRNVVVGLLAHLRHDGEGRLARRRDAGGDDAFDFRCVAGVRGGVVMHGAGESDRPKLSPSRAPWRADPCPRGRRCCLRPPPCGWCPAPPRTARARRPAPGTRRSGAQHRGHGQQPLGIPRGPQVVDLELRGQHRAQHRAARVGERVVGQVGQHAAVDEAVLLLQLRPQAERELGPPRRQFVEPGLYQRAERLAGQHIAAVGEQVRRHGAPCRRRMVAARSGARS